MHFLTARAYRHRTDNGPAVFSEFRKVIYIDRLPPRSAVDNVRRTQGDAELWIRSVDGTADTVQVLTGVAPTSTDAQVLEVAADGRGRFDRVDRALFRGRLRNIAAGSHPLVVITREPSGTTNVQRVATVIP